MYTREVGIQEIHHTSVMYKKFQVSLKVIIIFAGVGTRNYYRKIGYELDGPYMSKMLL